MSNNLSEENICAICQEKNTTESVDLSCLHKFHPKCIVQSLRRNNKCPVCRDTAGISALEQYFSAVEELNYQNSLLNHNNVIYSLKDIKKVTKLNRKLFILKSKYDKNCKKFTLINKETNTLLKKLNNNKIFTSYKKSLKILIRCRISRKRSMDNWHATAKQFLNRRNIG